jgi:hypothetical protein
MDAHEITICLGGKNAELGDACRTAFEPLMNQLAMAPEFANAPEDKDP